MTCIAALVSGKKVWMGGDSAGVAGYDLTVRADEKVFRNGPYVMGFTSSFRMGQLLRYSFKPPDPEYVTDLPKFMSTRFVNEVRKCLKRGGYAKLENDVESGGTFLVGVRGRLFVIDDDYQVGIPMDGFAAIGCGESIAVGAMYAQSPEMRPEDRVRQALEAAERFSAGVRAPFVIRST